MVWIASYQGCNDINMTITKNIRLETTNIAVQSTATNFGTGSQNYRAPYGRAVYDIQARSAPGNPNVPGEFVSNAPQSFNPVTNYNSGGTQYVSYEPYTLAGNPGGQLTWCRLDTAFSSSFPQCQPPPPEVMSGCMCGFGSPGEVIGTYFVYYGDNGAGGQCLGIVTHTSVMSCPDGNSITFGPGNAPVEVPGYAGEETVPGNAEFYPGFTVPGTFYQNPSTPGNPGPSYVVAGVTVPGAPAATPGSLQPISRVAYYAIPASGINFFVPGNVVNNPASPAVTITARITPS